MRFPTRDKVSQLKQVEKQQRQQGFWDGYAKREARSLSFEYQRAWRRGVMERAKDDTDEGSAA